MNAICQLLSILCERNVLIPSSKTEEREFEANDASLKGLHCSRYSDVGEKVIFLLWQFWDVVDEVIMLAKFSLLSMTFFPVLLIFVMQRISKSSPTAVTNVDLAFCKCFHNPRVPKLVYDVWSMFKRMRQARKWNVE